MNKLLASLCLLPLVAFGQLNVQNGTLTGVTNVSAAGLLSVTNGITVGVRTNYLGTAAISPLTNIPPLQTSLGAFSMVGQVTSNYLALAGSLTVYTNIFSTTPADRIILNGFTGSLVDGCLTNTAAGYYHFWFAVTVVPETDNNNDEFEAELFINGAGNEFYATWLTTTTGVRDSLHTEGLVYLTAGARCEVKMLNESDTSSSIPIIRVSWGFGTP